MEQAVEVADTRMALLAYIEGNPGIRYRELLRLTGLVNGVLTYHLTALEKANVIKIERQPRVTRYYPISITEEDSNILKYMRHEPARQVLLFILDHDRCTFNEIVAHSGKAPSTVSSHLKRLKDGGIVSVRFGEYQLYNVNEKSTVYEVLAKYQASFADRVIDNYVGIIEEL